MCIYTHTHSLRYSKMQSFINDTLYLYKLFKFCFMYIKNYLYYLSHYSKTTTRVLPLLHYPESLLYRCLLFFMLEIKINTYWYKCNQIIEFLQFFIIFLYRKTERER